MFSSIIMRNFNAIRLASLFIAFTFIFTTSMNSQISVNSTGGQTSTTTYATLKLAFDSINVGKHTGSIVILVNGNTTETATAVLNASGSGLASYAAILIKPSGGGLKTIAGSLAAPLIDLNGADNITIDGLYPGNDSLLIVNSSTSTVANTSTIRFINGATNNSVQNCGVLGGSASTTSGTIFFSTDASTTTGNDNNLISNLLLGDASSAATPRYAVYASGTPTAQNNYNTIKGCWIYNFNSGTTGDRAGIYIGAACSDFTIYNNSVYQETSRSVSSAVFSGIYITNTSGSFLIRKNKIGGSAPNCAGSALSLTSAPLLHAIYLNVASSSKTIVDSNTIANITMATSNTSIIQSLIHINNGKVDLKYNTLGSQSTASSISIPTNPSSTTFSVIGMGAGTFDTINISNNTIGGINITGSGMSLRGVDITGTTATMLINNNIFGSPTVANSFFQGGPNSILAIIMRADYAGAIHQVMNNTFANFTATNAAIRAIYTGGANSTFLITGNTLYNFSTARNTAGTGNGAAIVGIIASAGGPNQIISKNTIHSLKVTGSGAGAMTVSGINFGGNPSGNNIISSNLIHSLNVDIAGGVVNGIDISGANGTYYNNMIRLGIDELGAIISTPISINGIYENGGVNSIYYNSIYIGGSNVTTGTANTAALNSSVTSVNREIKNNIFVNVRSNSSSTGKHYAIAINNNTGQVINNNDYWTGSSFLAQNSTTDYSSLLTWQAATNQDSLSVSANPVFKNPGGSISTLNLHIDTAGNAVSYLESSGSVISGIATDYDNDARPGPLGSLKGGATKPDIGADEFDGVPRPPCANSIAGNAIATLDTICISGTVTLSLSGSSGLGVGNSYQWQSSSNGINYSNISNANLNVYATSSITTTTYYRCILTCIYGATSSISGAKKITVLNPQISSTQGAQRCGAGSVALNATASSGTIRWYSAATGGALLDTGAIFNTPSIATTTTYYVEAAIANCASNARTAVQATILTVPIITGITPGFSCGPGIVALSASCSAGTINWYSTVTGGTAIATGANFSTPLLSSTTTYYIDAVSTICTSTSRSAITATIIPLPTITSTTPSNTCGTGSVVLRAAASSGYVNWYSTATGGTVIDTGNTFTTPVIFAPTTYYAEAKVGNCVSSPRTAVLASVLSKPTINGVNSATGCKFDQIVLGATASAGTINWYNSSTGGTSIATGNSFTTPSLSATTVYYVDATVSGCTSLFRTPVTATINPTPLITSVTNASVCGSGALTLDAAASSGVISWYSDSIGGTLVFTGNPFNTPILNTTTTYFVETKDNGCTSSPRVRVTAKVKKIPTITTTTPASSCRPAILSLSANASNGNIRWYNVAFGGSALASGSTFTTPVLSATATYYVDAFDSGCVSANRTAVDATIYTAPNKSTTVLGNTITATATGLIYQWVDCNNNFALLTGETSKSFTATKNGSYAVIVKDNNCSDTSACTTFNKIGLHNNMQDFGFSLTPNPAQEQLFLITNITLLGKKFTILDLTGRILIVGTINQEMQTIPIETLAFGNYLFHIDDAYGKNIRFIKN